MVKFAEYVQLSGMPIRKEAVFGSRIIDFIKFVFYLQRCLLRSVVVIDL